MRLCLRCEIDVVAREWRGAVGGFMRIVIVIKMVIHSVGLCI